MTHVRKYTEHFRQEELRRGKSSLWYFAQVTLGFGALEQKWGKVQYDLCATLEARPPRPAWRRLVVCVYRDGFKCEAVGSEVRMGSGETKRIEDVVIGDRVLSYRPNGEPCIQSVVAVEPGGRRRILRIKLKGGREVRVSPEHRLFGPAGVVKAEELSPGSWLKVSRLTTREPTNDLMEPEEARLLAYMIADGCTTENMAWNNQRGKYYSNLNKGFTNFDEVLVEDFRRCAESQGFGVSDSGRKGQYRLSGASDWIRRYQLNGCYATNKRVPREIFRQSVEVILDFLAAFVDCDGSVRPRKKNSAGKVICILANEGLCRDLEVLAEICGIPSRISGPYSNDHAGCWHWSVSTHEGILGFPNLRSPRKQETLKKLKEGSAHLAAAGNSDPIPSEVISAIGGKSHTREVVRQGVQFLKTQYRWTPRRKLRRIGDITGNLGLQREAESGWGWAEVKEVEDSGEEDTVHLQVAETESYVSGGVLSHNSSITTQAYPWWRALYIPGFSIKIIENSSDNAKMNHFAPMVDVFTSGPRASYLRWLFGHRIPPDLKGWNSEQIQLEKGNDPFSAPTITYWGLESKKEGWHGDLVILDDADGADADKNPERNLDSYAAYRAAIPLLKNPATGQILVVGTPHGPDPLVYQLRDRELGGSLDNSRRRVKVFWVPLMTNEGDPKTIAEPKRFPPSLVEELKMDRANWDSQFMLRRPGSSLKLFDMERIRRSAYTFLDLEQTILRYRGFELTEEAVDAFREGEAMPELVETEETVHISECWPFMHFDPTHRDKSLKASRKGRSRPSEAAISITLVAPDSHVFLWRTWHKDCDIDEALHELFRLYRITGSLAVSFENTGAQVWLKKMVRDMERAIPALLRMECVGGVFPRVPLPPLSDRLVEFERGNEPKTELYRGQLSKYLNTGILHLNLSQEDVFEQLDHALDEKHAVDLVDTLAQGPSVWRTPPPPDMIRRFRQRRAWADRRMGGKSIADFRSPYARRHPAGPPF